MLKTLLRTTAVAAIAVASLAGTAAQSENIDISRAQAWLDGTLESYGDHDIVYDGEPIVLRATSHVSDLSESAKDTRRAFAILEKMSGGKIKVEPRFGGTVHGVKEGFEAARNGLTDTTACFTNLDAGSFPLTQGLTLPGIFPNAAVMAMVGEALAEQYFREEFERQGVAIGYTGGSTPFNFFSKSPVTNLAELEGLKVRSGSGISRDVYEALGATPVSMGSGDFYSSLQRGLVDVIATSTSAANTFRLNEVASHVTLTPINYTPLHYCFNARTMAKLPEDLREVVYDWGRQYSQVFSQEFIRKSAEYEKLFVEQGMIRHEIAPEEWVQWETRWAPLVDAWIAEGEERGLPARQLVADMRELAAKYGAMSYDDLMRMAIDSPVEGVAAFAN
ncbi:hypothetical protein ATO6_23430 [Oceanicola sp. 22II-s10i]|uniref:TRAP transporter substrate-binding protein n=1 Tax=Oceanicola sp. 22II-s10i TaxID=1317116 RepID=UPI000B520A86|nr:TRAP transporter substrate-binding protein DctP [Oceanicola sp. 22II-s10i]OWU81701.1 hypothetical protein ATO6_23430 [Oceanicola sp. 22II-s10i]